MDPSLRDASFRMTAVFQNTLAALDMLSSPVILFLLLPLSLSLFTVILFFSPVKQPVHCHAAF
jgi:hypothetical protein